jgi:hypothetical protein
MASSFTTNFGFEEIATGEQSGTWGTTSNFNYDILDRISSYTAVALSDAATATLTVREASPGEATENLQNGMYRVVKFTGSLAQACTITIAPNTTKAWFIFENATTDTGSSGPYSLIFTQGSGANITLQNGKNTIVFCDGAGSGAIVYDAVKDLQLSTLDATGDITGANFQPDGDTAASDTAAFGYTSVLGAIITGQGSTNDVTLVNDADATVLGIATGTTNVDIVGDVTASTLNADGDTAAADKAAVGYTSGEGIIITGQGSVNDVTIKNDADGEVCGVPTGTDDLRFPDDAKTEWGTGGDLQIYHDASNSYINDTGTGNLKIAASQIDLLGGTDGAETMATFADDGACTLYHDNTSTLATSATGVSITGTLVATTDTDTSNTGGVTLDFGANQNFVLTFTGNVTLDNPSTEQVGQSGIIVCIQDVTGGRTLSLGTDYETAGAAGITLSTAASAVDIVPYFVKAAGSIQLGAVQKAFA